VCLTTSTNYTSKQPSTYEKPEVASAVFWLLMMGSLSPETC